MAPDIHPDVIAYAKQANDDYAQQQAKERQPEAPPSWLERWGSALNDKHTLSTLDGGLGELIERGGRDVAAGVTTAAVNTASAVRGAAVQSGRGLAMAEDPAHAAEAARGPDITSPVWEHAHKVAMDFRDAIAVKDPTIADNLLQTGAQLMLPTLAYARALGALGNTAKWVAGGFVGDSTAADPHMPRMSDLYALGRQSEGKLGDLLRQVPGGIDRYLEYLADNKNESEAEGRFKNGVEGAIINTVMAPLGPLIHMAAGVFKQGQSAVRTAIDGGVHSLDDFPRPPAAPTRAAENNASNESSASKEAINRVEAERDAGVTRWRVDPDGNLEPLVGVDAVDVRAPKGSIHILRDANGHEVITDRGELPLTQANGLLARSKAMRVLTTEK